MVSQEGSIRRVAVLGAGTMGSQIAALIAAQGVECDLFDLSTDMVDDAKRRLLSMRPRVVDDQSILDGINAGSFDELQRLSQADWIVEAIVERAEPKLDLWRKAALHVNGSAVLSSNTSGIPIAEISQALPPGVRSRFLGTHFFNPPRYLRLLEVVPSGETDRAAIDRIRTFAEGTLGKGVVIARDVPGFITNRIGCFYFIAAMRAAEEYGLSVDEADAVSGPLMGRSNSATYRTIDLVGVDILLDICDNTRAAVTPVDEKRAFEPPAYMRGMRSRGWLGNKSGQGFYKRDRLNGQSRMLVLDTNTMQYVERREGLRDQLSDLSAINDTASRLRSLVSLQVPAGGFAWRTLSQLLAFSASKVGEVAEDIVSIDRAMRWGFNWELGPFETWDALGVAESLPRMEMDGLSLPGWVEEVAGAGGSFYRREGDSLKQFTSAGTYEAVSE